MAVKTKKIKSIAELVRALSADVKPYNGELWFRGQSDATWPLMPGYYRLTTPPPESTLLNRFKQSAAMLAEIQPIESFDWLMLMQHYGVPTRLLDWTENPMIGMYFALNSRANYPNKDAAFWVLKPSELNKHANVEDENDPYYIPSFNDEEPRSYTIEYLKAQPKIQQMPIAANAVRNNTRIQAQSGVFTIHHLRNIPLEEVGNAKHLIKYVIPADAKDKIASQLALLGLNKFQIFPELSTIGDMIRDEVK